MNLIFVTFALFLTYSITSSYGAEVVGVKECYVCGNMTTLQSGGTVRAVENCKDPFKPEASLLKKCADASTKSIPLEKPKDQVYVCAKFQGRTIGTVRGCFPEAKTAFGKNSCSAGVKVHSAEVTKCICSHDKCNDGSQLQAGILLSLCPIFVMLTKL